MKISEINKTVGKPELYESGTAFMWTDAYISKGLLKIHLTPDIDLGSRKESTIKKTAAWILGTRRDKERLNILDLGCGPGLYTEIFAERGHRVTGVDISKNSIDYAKKSAAERGFSIDYICGNYLELELKPETFDLVVLIYTDFGVLTPVEREALLKKVFQVLKPGGILIFDVLRDGDLENKFVPKSWTAESQGFWRPDPYLVLSESFIYPEEKVVLFQHHIIENGKDIATYRFWTHFFSTEDLKKILDVHKFENTVFRRDILPEGDQWSGDNVIFCLTQKPF